MGRILLLRLAAIGAVSGVVTLAQAQLLTHRDLSYAMAKTIAETAIDSCKAKGYAVFGGRGRSCRRGHRRHARRQRRPAHDGERAAQGLYGAQLSHLDDPPTPSASPTTTRWFASR